DRLVTTRILLLRPSTAPAETSPLARNQFSKSSSWVRSMRATFFIGSKRLRMARLTLPSESVSHNWLYFVVVVAVDKWEAAFCFPLIHSLFSSVARRQLAIAAVLRFQSCSNCVGLT